MRDVLSMARCTRCGAVVTEEMLFCEQCGQAVDAPPPTVVLSKMPAAAPVKTHKTAVIVLSVVCALLLIALGVACWFLVTSGPASDNGGGGAPTTTVPVATNTTALSATMTTTVVTTSTTTTTLPTTVPSTTSTTLKQNAVAPNDYPLSGRHGRVVTSDGDGVNMRLGPSTSYAVLTGLAESTLVDVLAEQDGWYYVEHLGDFGWVSGEFLQLL